MILYIASDWFIENGLSFYNYMFNTQLVHSIRDIKKSIAILMMHQLEETLTEEIMTEQITKICSVLIEEAAVDRNHITSQLTPSVNNQYRDILEYIHTYIDSKLTLDSISKTFFTSKTALSARFQEIFNVGFKKYVETLRIGLSLEYLNATDDTISYISERVGFSHSSLYTKKFKQYLEMTPNVYRKLTKFQKNMKYLLKDYNIPLPEKKKASYIRSLAEELRDWQDEKENIVYIDDLQPRFSPTRPFIMVIHIHNMSELRAMLIERKYKDIFEFDKEVMLLIDINLEKSTVS
ncbi:helix-turn-helix transcriptional regulator [Staphylococcus carnosus]|uniref:Truncated AraC/XylS family transcriptional regulator (Fragment 1) n=1 Tax=Staphylococcus carnosus (strain TM300) TaxID=396513 RepID=B9DK94_STACT|nr:AraC family transcriptional regulator [Staphylococcus carnosus]QPT03411.1 helix-turn-helix transcriptional regulator [Staphylococcus carnosus]UQA68416.1 AraC family transcriptional regulator [Staphylococcus carnosus]CAL27226.1 truncated AraC/XylS family transcriptional regulator (fragment 1) [Staphylococcus carnosus subsp. carnosus TM300]SUL91360.1 AraC family transcriptional regulator [Staphylococcus carnosus]GEP75832.1 hypothetical protein SCA04_01460 [Staphylococcus carnosus]